MKEKNRFIELADSFAHEMYACRDPRDRILLAMKWIESHSQDDLAIVKEEYFKRSKDDEEFRTLKIGH